MYELEDGKIAFIPNDLESEGILLKNKANLQMIIERDYFPNDNPNKEIFEIEEEKLRPLTFKVNTIKAI